MLVTIYLLKNKFDEKALNDILRKKVGLISIEIKNSEKSEIYYKFPLSDNSLAPRWGLEELDFKDYIILDAKKSSICINAVYNGNIISRLKEILFKEKILDEVYYKANEYKNNPYKYEANTDNIIEKIEGNPAPYDLFIIKHFIKFVIDKYNSTNENIENTEETKNISNNPFIIDEE